MRASFLLSLNTLAETNPNLMLLTGDLGYGVFEGFEKKFPKQYLNIGIAEQNMIGIASGLALEGKIVFVYSIGNFPTLRCLEQIRNDACYHELNINIVAMGGGFSYGALGMSHHATEDLAVMRSLPNIKVVAPCSVYEAGVATMELAKEKGVSYLRLDKSKATVDKVETFELGKSSTLVDGTDYTIFVVGGIAEEAIKASEILRNLGISLKVISMPTLKPIDSESVLQEVKASKGIITLEEGNVINGLGSAVLDSCYEHQVYPSKFKKMGIQDMYISAVGDQGYLRDFCGLTANAVSEVVMNWENSQ